MQGPLEKCVEHDKNLSQSVGYHRNIKIVKTPFVDEDALDSEENSILKDQECTQCGSLFWQQWLSKQLKTKKSKPSVSASDGGKPSASLSGGGAPSGSTRTGGETNSSIKSGSDWQSDAGSQADDSPVRGALGPIASKAVM